jgi:hypothetical protein
MLSVVPELDVGREDPEVTRESFTQRVLKFHASFDVCAVEQYLATAHGNNCVDPSTA